MDNYFKTGKKGDKLRISDPLAEALMAGLMTKKRKKKIEDEAIVESEKGKLLKEDVSDND